MINEKSIAEREEKNSSCKSIKKQKRLAGKRIVLFNLEAYGGP